MTNKLKKISLSILAISATHLAAYQYEPNQLVQQNMIVESNKIDDIQKDESELLDSSSGEIKTAQGTLSYSETLDNFEISLNNKLIYSLKCDDEDSAEIKKYRVNFSCSSSEEEEIYQVRKIQDDIVFLFKNDEDNVLKIIYFNEENGIQEAESSENREFLSLYNHLVWGGMIKYGGNLINESNGIKSIYVKDDKLFIELNRDKENNFKYQYYYSKGIVYPDFDVEWVIKKMEENNKILKNNVAIESDAKSIDLASGQLSIIGGDTTLVYLNQELVDKVIFFAGKVDFSYIGQTRFFKQKDESFFLVSGILFRTTGIAEYEIIEYSPQAIRRGSTSISRVANYQHEKKIALQTIKRGSASIPYATNYKHKEQITLLPDGIQIDWGVFPDGIHYIDEYKNGKVTHKKIVDSEKQEKAILEKCTKQHEFIVEIYKDSFDSYKVDYTNIKDWSTAARGYEPQVIWKDKRLYNDYIKIIRDAMNGNLVDFNEFREKYCQVDM